MFCGNCGSKLNDGAKFCSDCGAKVPSPTINSQNTDKTDTLPAGMTRSPDGKIWWSFIEKKKEVMCYIDDTSIAVMHEAERSKKRSAAASLLLDIAEWAAMDSDSYDPFLPLPSELEGKGATPTIKLGDREFYHYPYELRRISTIKEDKKHNILKLYCYTWWTIYLTDEQYDFVLMRILAARPDIKRK